MTVDKSSSVTEKTSFTEINLSESGHKKPPKRLVYFSDGVLEEYSTDEETDAANADTQPLIDSKTLPWVPYFGYLIWWIGSRTLSVCDYLGENLAWFLGITSPKFQYELDQYEKIMKEEEEFENYVRSENAGWSLTCTDGISNSSIELQPQTQSITMPVKSDAKQETAPITEC